MESPPLPGKNRCLGTTQQGRQCRNQQVSLYCSRHRSQQEPVEPDEIIRRVESINQRIHLDKVPKIILPDLPPPRKVDKEEEDPPVNTLSPRLVQMEIDLQNRKEALDMEEDRLARLQAYLIRREALLKEQEEVVLLLIKEDPAPFEARFKEMEESFRDFTLMFKRIHEYKDRVILECCVCYNSNLTQDQLLPCKHPVCLECNQRLPKRECPMCKRTI